MPGVMEEDWQHAIEAACRGRHPSQVQTLILDEALRRPSGYLPSPSLFQTFSQLRILSIAHIRLVSLTNFPSLPHLHRLILCNNRISGGLDNLLRAGLANLRYLDLSENNIEFLEDLSPLMGFNFLVSLDLSECPVTRTPEYRPQLLAMLKSLRVLDKRNAHNGERVESEEEDFKEDDYEEDGFEEDDYEEDDIEEDDFEDDNEEEEEEELANGNNDENNGFVFENGRFGALNGRHDIHQADGDEDGESEEVDVEDEYFDRIPQRRNPLDNIEGSGSESEEEVENHIGNGIGIQNGNGVVRDVEEESGDDNDDDDDGESGSFGSINGEIDALDNGEVQSEDEDVNSNSNSNSNNNNNDNNNNNNNNNNNEEEEDSDNEEDYGAEYVVHPVEQADEGEASDFEPGEEDEYNDEDEDNGENEDVEDVADDQPASSCRKQKRSRDEGGFDSDQDGRQPKRT